MNNNQIAEKAPAFEFSQEIDGRVYVVRAFFKDEGETLQRKTERMIERELISLARNVHEPSSIGVL